MQVLKDELRHRILLESEHLFLQRGYDRTSMQMIADKVNISKGNLYHYFKNKEELFYELTDSAAEGLKNLILRSRSGRFSNIADSREFQLLLQEEILSLLLAEKYGLLLIMEQGKKAHATSICVRRWSRLSRNRSNRCLRTRRTRCCSRRSWRIISWEASSRSLKIA